ncbi:MAG TPA: DUF3047 domain-containing protein [Gammaproteobacteria bacterium]
MKAHLFALLLVCTSGAAEERRIEVGRFAQRDLSGWQTETFAGETRYELESTGDGFVLRADSQGTASGRVRRITIDLEQTPYLHWSWRVGNIFRGNDERSRRGDDYPARLYVIFSGGVRFWRTRAINYVWSSHLPVGTSWPNAFTRQAHMLAVDSGQAELNQWVSHRRDVRADYRRLFGEEATTIDAVAIMSDSDNTGQHATAWYGDIWFSTQ